jgi:hypothetical protein
MANFPDTVDDFGSAIAVKGDQIYVGAPGKYFNLGVVYAYKRNGGNWPQYNMLAASTLQFGQRFGASISIEGDFAFFGAPDDGGTGRVFVMKAQGAGWSHHSNFAPATLQSGDQFGGAVSVFGTEAAVGAPQRNSTTGEVFFYEFDGSNWQANGSHAPGNASPGDAFGGVLSINSGWLAAGVPAHNSATGKVYLYQKLGGTWILDQELVNPNLLPDAEFGQGVAVNSNEQLLVGSPGDDNDRGSLFAYEYNGSWTEQQHIQSGNVSPMTTELWVYLLDRSSTNPVFADNNTALRLNTATDHRLNVKYPAIDPKFIDYVVPLQTWTHLAYAVDAANNTTKVYANGRLVAELPEEGFWDFLGSESFTITLDGSRVAVAFD